MPLLIHKMGYGKLQVQQRARPVKIHAVPLLAGRERTCPVVSSWPGQSATNSCFSVIYFFQSQKGLAFLASKEVAPCLPLDTGRLAAGRLKARAAIRALSSTFVRATTTSFPSIVTSALSPPSRRKDSFESVAAISIVRRLQAVRPQPCRSCKRSKILRMRYRVFAVLLPVSLSTGCFICT